ncbi:M15 family metallopeptidase [Candidatus Saccharibacteria bacterium]|nr:M15 family metallopeptidase [Candidatus Saccharibacteria bacterium]
MKIRKDRKLFYYITAALTILIVILVAYICVAEKAVAPTDTNASKQSEKTDPQKFNKTRYSIDEPGSPWWIVSKNRPLTEGYLPPDLVTPNVSLNTTKSASENTLRRDTAAALEKLFAAAKLAGIDYMLASGYRSETLQASYYNNYVAKSGQAEADRYSARPGTSEHQTGMALDVATIDRRHYLDQAFGEDPGGIWLASHAHEYGFIVRYQKDKEPMTGYMYEPWHIRYVGTDLAKKLYSDSQTMEEFFGLYFSIGPN